MRYIDWLSQARRFLEESPLIAFHPDPRLTKTTVIYTIVSASSLEDLAAQVNDRLQFNWIPAGGVLSFSQHTGDADLPQPRPFFAQALMSYDSLPDEFRASGSKPIT